MTVTQRWDAYKDRKKAFAPALDLRFWDEKVFSGRL